MKISGRGNNIPIRNGQRECLKSNESLCVIDPEKHGVAQTRSATSGLVVPEAEAAEIAF
jgi:hypothetical protein